MIRLISLRNPSLAPVITARSDQPRNLREKRASIIGGVTVNRRVMLLGHFYRLIECQLNLFKRDALLTRKSTQPLPIII